MVRSVPKINNQKGISLVEILIATVVFGLIIGVMYTQFFMGWNMWDMINGQLEIQQDSMVTLKWIRDDIRCAGYTSIMDLPADGQWYPGITFLKATDVFNNNVVWSQNPIQYSFKESTGEILRDAGGKSFPISRNANWLRFRRLPTDPALVEVEIGFGKNTLKAALNNRHSMLIKLRN